MAARAGKLPKARDLQLHSATDDPSNIYVNEQLSAYNSGLHKKATDLRALGARFVWTNMGRVLVRLDSNSDVVYVKNDAVIDSEI